ncbi:MAG: hypothetical protein GX567_02545 [Clostridia bacterium]|nr:hypothetical protein [Clostridia bacterium]
MISGRIAGKIAQNEVAKYKKRRAIRDEGKIFTEAHGETGFVYLFAFFMIFIGVILLVLLPFLPELIETEKDRIAIIALYSLAGLEFPVLIYTFIYFKTWKLSREGDTLILKKFWKRQVISLPEMKLAVQNGRAVKRTARHYCLPLRDRYCKINITQTYGAIQIVEDALQECGIAPLPKVGSRFYE